MNSSATDELLSSGSDIVDALILAAAAVGCQVEPARVAQVGRDCGTDVLAAARRLGVPVRAVSLSTDWWSGDSGPYVVQVRDSGTAAAIPRAGHYLLMGDSGSTRIDHGIAASLTDRAWAVTPRLSDAPTDLRHLATISISTGSRSDAVLAVVAAMATTVLGIAAPVLSGYVVGGLVELGTGVRTIAVGILLVMVAISAAGLALMESLLLQRVATRFNSRTVAAVLDRVVRLPLSFFRSDSAGSLVGRITGLDHVAAAINASVVRIGSGLLLAISGILVMCAVSVTLAIRVCMVLLCIGVAVAFILRHQVHARNRYLTQALELSGITLSMFAGISKIRVAGAESRMQALWTRIYARQQRAAGDAARGVQWLALVAAMTPILVIVTVVIGNVGQTAGLSLGEFTAFVAAASQSSLALASMLGPLVICMGTIPLLREIRPILAAEPEPQGLAAAEAELLGGVELADVSFQYDAAGPMVLSHISMQIAPGEFVAIVGASGSGKSTLLRVLIGLEQPTTGGVLFDGRPLERLGADSVRRQVGAMTQSAQLSSGTILDNIIGTSNLSETDAWAAAETAGIASDLRAMPMGLRTFVSDGANTFSGGQKQRILLARALARQPKILLLDEATSALDNSTQHAIACNMQALGATQIVVAHRLSTIKNADRIYLLDRGAIVECGSFEELMARRGAFARFASRQLTALDPH